MFGDTLTIKGYGGVGDTTGPAATFNKISTTGRACRYGLSTNTPECSTFIDIRYSDGPRKTLRRRSGDGSLSASTKAVRKFLVKVTKVTYDPVYNRWNTTTVNFTVEYDAGMSVDTTGVIKDLGAYASNLVGVTANHAKLLAQEA